MKDDSGKIRIETVKTDRFSMDYFRFGRGEKTLVILPGLSVQSVMASAELVADAYEQMTEAFTIYVFDRIKDVPDTYDLYDMARDTAEAIRAAGLEKVCIFGASQGGMMSMVIAMEHPDMIEKMVVSSTSCRLDEDRWRLFEEWISIARSEDATRLYLAFGEALYPTEVFESARQLYVDAAKTVTKDELRKFIIMTQSMKGFDITGDLDRIKCPLFAIGSRDDKVLGAKATEELGEHLKNRSDFEMFMYDGFGHAVYDTAPDFQQRILRFLV